MSNLTTVVLKCCAGRANLSYFTNRSCFNRSVQVWFHMRDPVNHRGTMSETVILLITWNTNNNSRLACLTFVKWLYKRHYKSLLNHYHRDNDLKSLFVSVVLFIFYTLHFFLSNEIATNSATNPEMLFHQRKY